jgi:acyl-CoA synthetase (AMP-forming)/AMP-acid ligase II
MAQFWRVCCVLESHPLIFRVQGYGLTETNAYVCSVAGADYLEKVRPNKVYILTHSTAGQHVCTPPIASADPNSSGPPVPICDIKIVDPDTGKPQPVGKSGLLLVRGPQVMKCYVGDAGESTRYPSRDSRTEATRRALDSDGWFDTGDIANVDAEGFVYIRDRREPANLPKDGGHALNPSQRRHHPRRRECTFESSLATLLTKADSLARD